MKRSTGRTGAGTSVRLGETIAALAAFSTLFAVPETADACGGLFCSASAPVEQTAERIVFARNSDETITAIIEIQYQGPSEKFGWLLPMPGTPQVNVSAQAALDAIDRATEPSYQLAYDYGQCSFPEFADDASGDDESTDDTSSSEEPGIEVLDQGTAGPYDYVIISADPELDEPANVAVDWLIEAGYDVGDIGPDVLRPYLAEGLNLVAFRLTKGNDVGTIRPVMITYDGTKPSIPIRPTQVAAAPDMGIRVFLLGDERAVSDNYLSLELNEARINWFDWRSNYDDVVSAAADEAGGHGFVSEYAGSTTDLAQRIWDSEMAERWETLQQSVGDGIDLMMEARWPFASYEGFRRAVEAATTLPAGVSLDEFASDPRGYDGVTVDREVFLATLDEDVVKPLQQAQELVDSFPFLSRLYTTLSPEEMVVDPSFVFNADLPDVSNVHSAQIAFQCTEEIQYPWDAPWTITLPSGGEISGVGEGNWNPNADDLPAAATILQLGGSDEGEVIIDNRVEIEEGLAQLPAAAPAPEPPTGQVDDATDDDATDDDATDDETDDDETDEQVATRDVSEDDGADDGCSLADVGPARHTPAGRFAVAALALAGLAWGRRRRGQ